MPPEQLPTGTPIRVIEQVHQTDPSYGAETVGVVEAWKEEPTGAWYAHSRNGKLWLQRLTLRKADGELTTLVIDNHTKIYPLEPLDEEGGDGAASATTAPGATKETCLTDRLSGPARGGARSQNRRITETARAR
jgi:hypothetical protein